MKDKTTLSPDTLLSQANHYLDPATGGVIPPIQPSTTFARDEEYRLYSSSHSYGRDENPGYRGAETLLAQLEGGSAALLFSSGMAAATAIVGSLEPGDHIVAPKVMYWGLRNWLAEYCGRWGLGLDFFDMAEAGSLASAVKNGETKLVWIETPCNPTWDVVDIAECADIAHDAGSMLAVDSTVATPLLTQPLRHGADLVMHSATKYLNGHSDLVMGALVAAEDNDLWQRIAGYRAHGGNIAGSFEAWLLLRGMRTLHLRVQRSCETAMRIARHFESHPKLERVLYPGLDSHPGHETAKKQMQGGFGGMLSICVKGGANEALAVANRCDVFIRATSLGGVESLVEHRYSIEGPDSPIPENLLRLSIGVEAAEDLIADLEQALA